jgi:hypothetical protein
MLYAELNKAVQVVPKVVTHRNNNNSIQFNSIYLCAKLNSHRPITKLAQVVRRRRRRRSKELES